MTDTWERALADCEGRLDRAAATLTGGTSDVDPFSAPALPIPMPAALVDHARELVRQGEALEERLTGEQDRIRAELRRLPRMPRAARQSHFDTKA